MNSECFDVPKKSLLSQKKIKYWGIICSLISRVFLAACLLVGTDAISQTVYFHNDTTGSPIASTGSNGSLLWKEDYKPFGEQLLRPVTANTQWFHGKAYDYDSGFQDFGARNYDPVLGRFLSIDPVEVDASNVHSFNRYAYGNNNPLRYKDPNGEIAETVFDLISLSLSLDAFRRQPTVGNFVGAAIDAAAVVLPGVPGGVGIIRKTLSESSAARAKPIGLYEVGPFKELKKREVPGDKIEIHHAIQAHPAEKKDLVPGYNRKTGPAISLPEAEHRALGKLSGEYKGTAQELLDRDVNELRTKTKAPEAAIEKLIELNHTMYPDSFPRNKR